LTRRLVGPLGKFLEMIAFRPVARIRVKRIAIDGERDVAAC
jgi:hypothetical protein